MSRYQKQCFSLTSAQEKSLTLSECVALVRRRRDSKDSVWICHVKLLQLEPYLILTMNCT
ncbi:unnamed protein product [Chondrus crispus]|uniref:Uncharacterized protein n=1 Tax=Chondrus crispus TaxID=2769 RepID=R7QQ27_CHOCR|nr:unnamed protein product [Chondrus crispus]CDF40224.1 unnamed protein product [Chondrus crispus]|eukprot:XP_005710518.1 unnamed protein product [Chondrus crispus]